MVAVILLAGQAIMGWLWSVTLLPMPRHVWVHVTGVGVVFGVLLSQLMWGNDVVLEQSFLLVSALYWLHHQYGVFSWLEKLSRLVFVPFFLMCWGPLVEVLPVSEMLIGTALLWIELGMAVLWWVVFIKCGLTLGLLNWAAGYLLLFGTALNFLWWYFSRYQLHFETRYHVSLELVIVVLLIIGLFGTQYLRRMPEEAQNVDAYVVDLEAQIQELRIFKHEYVNTLRVLEDSLHTGNLSDVTEVYQTTLATTHDKLDQAVILDVTQLPHLLRGLMRHKYQQARQKHVKLEMTVIGEWQQRKVDEWALYQLLAIYLDNAIEASPPDGMIVVIFNAVQQPFVQVRNPSDEIPAPDIWQRASYTTKKGHSGLGLTIAQRIEKQQAWQAITSWEAGQVVQTVILGE